MHLLNKDLGPCDKNNENMTSVAAPQSLVVSMSTCCQCEQAGLIKVSGHLGAVDKSRQQALLSAEY